MKNKIITFSLIAILAILISCVKKEVKNPTITSQTIDTTSLMAPCAAKLVNNRISSSEVFDRFDTCYFTPYVINHFGYLEIQCRHYSSSNQFTVSVPTEGGFLGQKKYTLQGWNEDPKGNYAKLSHGFLINGAPFYQAQSGDLFAKYTSKQLELTFCNITVKDSDGDSHVLNGKVTIDL